MNCNIDMISYLILKRSIDQEIVSLSMNNNDSVVIYYNKFVRTKMRLKLGTKIDL